jgi:hypothetical protein
MGERQFPRLVRLEVPKVGQSHSHVKPNGPIVIFAVDRIGLWTALRVTANAGVVRRDIIEPPRIDDRRPHWVGDVSATRSVTSFAADIPLCDAFCLDVVIDRVAAVAQGAGRTLHIVVGVKGRPPIGVLRHMGGEPARVRDVPLGRQREIIVAPASEIALLPPAAVCERDIVLRERQQGIRLREVIASGCSRGSRTTFAIRVFRQRS